MKVVMKNKKQEIDCWVGDIVLFNNTPCMVIGLRIECDYYGILALEGDCAGKVIEEFYMLSDIDEDERVTELLIKQYDVVISKGE